MSTVQRKLESLFEKNFRTNMKGGSIEAFRKKFHTLYNKVIMKTLKEVSETPHQFMRSHQNLLRIQSELASLSQITRISRSLTFPRETILRESTLSVRVSVLIQKMSSVGKG